MGHVWTWLREPGLTINAKCVGFTPCPGVHTWSFVGFYQYPFVYLKYRGTYPEGTYPLEWKGVPALSQDDIRVIRKWWTCTPSIRAQRS